VLVHCSQGVSRSTTIAIAYLMWKTGKSYDDMYKVVRGKRGVTSPNVGFMCQLMNWEVSILVRAGCLCSRWAGPAACSSVHSATWIVNEGHSLGGAGLPLQACQCLATLLATTYHKCVIFRVKTCSCCTPTARPLRPAVP